MQIAMKWTMPWVIVAMGLSMTGCSKEEEQPKPAPSAAKPPPPPPAAPAVPEKPPEPKLNPNCPTGSKGEGSLGGPCEASGKDRVMDVVWNGKMDDKGPLFKVTNRTKSAILYGKIAVYFYDKSGKQLEVASLGGASEKGKPFLSCSGNMFGGVVKPEEKFTLTFSCVKKERVPEGTKAIEAEMQMVGFADSSEKAVDYYWRNNDLSPDERKKGAK